MESSSAGPIAAPATPLPVYSQAHVPLARPNDDIKLEPRDHPPALDFGLDMDDIKLEPVVSHENSVPIGGSFDTPIHAPFVNHFQASNLRGSIDDRALAGVPAPEDPFKSQIPTQESSAFDDVKSPFASDPNDALAQYGAQVTSATLDDPFTEDGTQTQTQFTEEDEDHGPMQAYAKLCLPDGDYFVTSLQVIVGRDMDYWRQYVREKKRAERAQQALDEYALEPSQPSQPEDGEVNRGPSSRSSQSLAGRPAKALPSNYSEQGGAVYYPALSDEEEYTRRSRKKRRAIKSTASTTSIAPATLHPNMSAEFGASNSYGTDSGNMDEQASPQMVSIHPANRDDIRLISKEHLFFDYNFDDEKWELTILGNRAFVNNELHQRGANVPLSHGDEIIVTSVSIYFKLPENRLSPGPSRGTFMDSERTEAIDEDLESLTDGSPSRRRSSMLDAEYSELDDDDGTENHRSSNKTKLKLSLKKKQQEDARKSAGKDKPVKLNLKGQKKTGDESSLERSPEAVKKAEKGKRPMKEPPPLPETPMAAPPPLPEFSLQSAEGVDLTKIHEALRADDSAVSGVPAPPPVIEPGSIFEGVAAEDLPQKRKGPGRPPKNGLISKRDQSFVKRKLKEYEKRGQAPPPMDELVAMVRAENKAKELAAKAAARGEALPETSIMPSIELDPSLMNMGRSDAGPASDMAMKTSAAPAEPVRKPSPKPKRVVKSPSPMKPESDYTEEELKKPTVTYVHILDEVLRDHPTGKADLQEIYDRICKRYPYFKYRVNTAGWQSSVRHNLLQHDRFVENGRSGKGRLWTINFDCPIDKEKKRRVTPPPRPPMPPMQGGTFGPQYGQPAYNSPYGQPAGAPPFNAGSAQGTPGNYYSPYTSSQPNQGGAFNSRPGGAPGTATPTAPGHQQPQQHHPSHGPQYPSNRPPGANAGGQQQAAQQRAPQNPPQFQGIVDEIMQYRSQYLARFQPDSDSFKEHDELFRNCTTFISNIFHGQSASVEGALKTDEERRVYADLEKIFARYQHLRGPPGTTPTAESKDSTTPQATNDGENGVSTSGLPGSTQAGAPSIAASAPVSTANGTSSVYASQNAASSDALLHQQMQMSSAQLATGEQQPLSHPQAVQVGSAGHTEKAMHTQAVAGSDSTAALSGIQQATMARAATNGQSGLYGPDGSHRQSVGGMVSAQVTADSQAAALQASSMSAMNGASQRSQGGPSSDGSKPVAHSAPQASFPAPGLNQSATVGPGGHVAPPPAERPPNSAQEPIVILDGADIAPSDAANVTNVNPPQLAADGSATATAVVKPTAGTKRTADVEAGADDNESKRVKTS